MSNHLHLRAVVFQRRDWWVAQVLEHDIAAQGRTLESLLAELRRVLTVHVVAARVHGTEPFADLREAPERYWQLYASGAPVAAGALHRPEENEEASLEVHAAVLDLAASPMAAHP